MNEIAAHSLIQQFPSPVIIVYVDQKLSKTPTWWGNNRALFSLSYAYCEGGWRPINQQFRLIALVMCTALGIIYLVV